MRRGGDAQGVKQVYIPSEGDCYWDAGLSAVDSSGPKD